MDPLLGKRQIRTLATMADSGLLTKAHLDAWAEHSIARLDAPPVWVLDLYLAKDLEAAVAVLLTEAYAPPFEPFDSGDVGDEFLACLLLRRRRGDLDWTGLLREGAEHLHLHDGRVSDEWLWDLHDQFERGWRSNAIEEAQRRVLDAELAAVLGRVERLYLEVEACAGRTGADGG